MCVSIYIYTHTYISKCIYIYLYINIYLQVHEGGALFGAFHRWRGGGFDGNFTRGGHFEGRFTNKTLVANFPTLNPQP